MTADQLHTALEPQWRAGFKARRTRWLWRRSGRSRCRNGGRALKPAEPTRRRRGKTTTSQRRNGGRALKPAERIPERDMTARQQGRNGGRALKPAEPAYRSTVPSPTAAPQWRAGFKARRTGRPDRRGRPPARRNGGRALKPAEPPRSDRHQQRDAAMGLHLVSILVPQWRAGFKARRTQRLAQGPVRGAGAAMEGGL